MGAFANLGDSVAAGREFRRGSTVTTDRTIFGPNGRARFDLLYNPNLSWHLFRDFRARVASVAVVAVLDVDQPYGAKTGATLTNSCRREAGEVPLCSREVQS
jgi:hypothetical protein